jgi:hypothetical protein
MVKQMDEAKFASRLRKAISASSSATKNFLRFRRDVLDEMVGTHYGSCSKGSDGKFKGRYHVNKIGQAFNVYSRLLAARNPRVKLKTDNPEHRPVATSFEAYINRDLAEMRYQDQLQKIILDGLALYGVCKTGLNASGEGLEIDGVTYDPGEPYVQRVSPERFLFDINARDWDNIQWCGDLVTRDWEFVRESGLYKNLDGLNPDSGSENQPYSKAESASEMSRSNAAASATLFDTISFWEIYIPRDHVVISMPVNGEKIIRVQECLCNEWGPYEMLGFMSMPDNVLPKSPAMDWMDMHNLIVQLTRKFAQQAQRQKTILAVLKKAAKDGKKIQLSEDGQIITVDQKGGAEEVSLGGIDPKNYAFLVWCIQQFNLMAGNLELLAGLSPQSETFGQDQLLSQNAGVAVDDMRSKVVQLTQRVVDKLAWLRWTDPLNTYKMTKKIPGLPFSIETSITPEQREWDLGEVNIEVEPYSMLPRSPEQDRQELVETVGNIIMPLAPVLQQQGLGINATELLGMLQEYGHVRDLDRVVSELDENGMPISESHEAKPGPTKTTREYVRRNVSGKTTRGTDTALAQTMMGAGGDPAQLMMQGA